MTLQLASTEWTFTAACECIPLFFSARISRMKDLALGFYNDKWNAGLDQASVLQSEGAARPESVPLTASTRRRRLSGSRIDSRE